jgi:2-polyprenyl-3-methyl-5-hydroxy-6-metoxy-1,4-benzoquinol methylase/methyltransferase-like protein
MESGCVKPTLDEKYKDVPYVGQPVPGTSPSEMALISWVHAGPRPSVAGARILEIGCGDGGNLMPMAYYHPSCSFVGLDACQPALDEAQRACEKLGLSNLQFYQQDVEESVRENLGVFDFIIAHGVYSWVNQRSQESLWVLVSQLLKENGLLFLSYNTYPGWKMRGVVRRMLLQKVGEIQPLKERALQAKREAEAFQHVLPEQGHPYHQLMRQELNLVQRSESHYLIHGLLADENHAFWFRDVVNQAEESEFEYVAEGWFNRREGWVPPNVRQSLMELGYQGIDLEEAVDLMWYRQMRTSLFCKKGQRKQQGPDLSDLVAAVTIAANLSVVDEPTAAPGVFYFEGKHGFRFHTDNELASLVLDALRECWPCGSTWSGILSTLGVTVALTDKEEANPQRFSTDIVLECQQILLHLYTMGQVDFRITAIPDSKQSNSTTAANPLVRWQARRMPMVTTPSSEQLLLTHFEQAVLQRLDGSKEPSELVDEICQLVEAGEMHPPHQDVPLGNPIFLKMVCQQQLDELIDTWQKWGMMAATNS